MSKKNLFISSLLAIIIFGSFLRLHNLSNQPYWMDEGYTINAVISAQENGITKSGASILDSGKNYFCPLYCIPTEKISNFAGNNAFSFRILSAIFGILSILLIFFVAKLIFKNTKTAILSAFLMSFSYWQIAWSRQARWYTMLLLFFWLSIFFFYRAIYRDKNKILNYSLTILFLILAILTHRIAVILPFIFIFQLISNNFKKNKKSIIAIIIFLITPFALAPGFFINSLKNIQLSYNLPYYLNFYFRNYFIFIILIIFYYFSSLCHSRENGNPKSKQKIIFLILPFAIYLILLSFFTNIVHYRYLFHLTPIFYVLGAVATIDIYEKIRHNYLKYAFIIIVILAFFILKQGVIWPQNFYFLEADNPNELNRPYYAYTPQPDFNAAYNKIKENLKPDEVIISSHPHFNKIFLGEAGYWLSYEYLGFDKDINLPPPLNLPLGQGEKIAELDFPLGQGEKIAEREYYAGAEAINNLDELKNIARTKHGYIVFDYMATDGRIDTRIINYIQTNFSIFFYNKINSYSQIWVYHF